MCDAKCTTEACLRVRKPVLDTKVFNRAIVERLVIRYKDSSPLNRNDSDCQVEISLGNSPAPQCGFHLAKTACRILIEWYDIDPICQSL
jgi:hypothetical protein